MKFEAASGAQTQTCVCRNLNQNECTCRRAMGVGTQESTRRGATGVGTICGIPFLRVRTPEGEIFVGLADMVRPQGREGGGGETTDADPDAANARLYDDTVRKVFDQLGVEWKVIEERIIAVVLDGAGTMGAYVGLLNAIREKGRKELIGWVKDAAHCLMRAISTAKGKVKVWYDALDDLVSFLACF